MSTFFKICAMCAVWLVPTGSWAQDVLFIDASDRIPIDANANDESSSGLKLIDLDGDGDLDMYVANGSASLDRFPDQVLINDGSGTFADETATRIAGVTTINASDVDFADIDGDGDLDAVMSSLEQEQVLINDGKGFFTEESFRIPQASPPGPPGFAVSFPPFFLEPSADAQFFDINGDGHADILVSNENPFPFFGPSGDLNRVLVNDGTGFFIDASDRVPTSLDQTSGFSWGDIDGDGDLDLVQANRADNFVFINDGTGVFGDETAIRLAVPPQVSRVLALGDVDGDGDLDIFEGNSSNQQNRLFLNDGKGRFADVTEARVPGRLDTTTDIDLVDVDGDGDLDAYVANVGDFARGHGFTGDQNQLLINDGSGKFVDGSFPRIPEEAGRSSKAVWGDVDGDGFDDLVVATFGAVELPDFPPPDGAERLYLSRPCARYPEVCVGAMLEGLAADLAALDPLTDMTASDAHRNARRKAKLLKRLARAQKHFDRGRAARVAKQLRRILKRVDGDASSPDWVLPTVAERLVARLEFALRACW